MAASRKRSKSSRRDSGQSSRVDRPGVSEVEALEPLLELLLDLQASERGSTSEPSEILSGSNPEKKRPEKQQKKDPQFVPLTPSETRENAGSNPENFGAEAAHSPAPESPEKRAERFDKKPDQNLDFGVYFNFNNRDFLQENYNTFPENLQKNEEKKPEKIPSSSDSKELDLTGLRALLEVPADALDVSYTVVSPDLKPPETEPNFQPEKPPAVPSENVESEPDKIGDSLESLDGLKVASGETNPDDPLEQLQDLIFGSTRSDLEELKEQIFDSELPAVRELLEQICSQLQSLENQIYEPEQLMGLIYPWIAAILSYKVNESKEDVIQALKPIIDEIIIAKSRENREKMSRAIADLIPEAIKFQISNSPQEIAQAIGPEIGAAIREQIRLDRDEIVDALAPTMGKAIKEQVTLERDAMVDALYPVIGSTITRYLGEAIREINDKVSNALSAEGINRKIRARVQGVSEAELILQEVMKCTVQAVFLIHKSSGLIISEVQQLGEARLESEMLAGMLTAIRSFVNDCIVGGDEIKELSEIEYGDSRIIIEVAGYCYLAVIVTGEINRIFLRQIRKILVKITQKYGREIEAFDGDPDTVPPEILAELEKLMEAGTKRQKEKSPNTLLVLAGVILGSVLVPFAVVQYRGAAAHRVETQVAEALDSEPELAVYRLGVEAKNKTVTLTGKLPNQRLREKAENIVEKTAPNLTVDNEIIAVQMPPDPVLVAAEVERMTEALNQINGISIVTDYEPDRVKIEGKVIRESDREKVTQAFEKIEGVNSVFSAVQVEALPIPTRIYFNKNSSELMSEDMIIKIYPVSQYLKQYPDLKVRIVGYSHPEEKFKKNAKLALRRSQTVQTALESYGIDRRRMIASGKNEYPPGVEKNQPDWLSRAVIFEIILPEDLNE